MSSLKCFMKQNKTVKENTTFPATKSLKDENGEPLRWTIKALTTKEHEAIREECTKEVPVKGKAGMYRAKVDTNKFISKLMVASILEPNLYSAELQDSYGVSTPEDLLKEMIDNPGEYTELSAFINEFNGFDVSIDDKVEEAKN